MNIIFLTRFFWPHAGGVERHVFELGRELLKLGHKITIITLRHDKKLKNEQSYRGIKIIHLPYSNSKLGIWENMWQNRKILKEADIIHCHDVFFWYLPFRFLWPGKSVFTTFHGWEGVYPVPRRYRLMHQMAEKLSRGNICVGDYLVKYYGTKADYITYGAPTFSYSDRSTKILKEIIFIGRLEEDLGLSEYFKAIKLVGLPAVFVGDGSLRKEAGKLGRVTGFVNNLRPYFQRPAAVFTSSYLTIWNALACGRAVFALYHNPLKKDYLESFPAAGAINISGSTEELADQFKRPKTAAVVFPTWKQVAQTYLKLWQKH